MSTDSNPSPNAFRAPVWQRALLDEDPSDAQVLLFVFSPRPFPQPGDGTGPTQFHDWSPYADWPDGIRWEFMQRAQKPEFFEQAERGFATIEPEGDSVSSEEMQRRFATAQYAARIVCETEDTDDLGYLQFTWAVARWLIESGANAIVDTAPYRLWPSEAVLAWHRDGWPGGRRFSLEREIRIQREVVDGQSVRFTHGMAKFGQPDVMVVAENPWLEEVFGVTCQQLALGKRYHPGEVIQAGGGKLRLDIWRGTPDVGELGPTMLLTPVE